MISFAVERLSSLSKKDRELFVRQWRETAQDRESIPLDPDWSRYEKMEEANVLHITTAREGGELVGYLVYLIAPHHHSRGSVSACGDVIYLVPEQRKGTGAGIELFRVAERSLRARGVRRILQGVGIEQEWGPVLEYLGYRPFEVVFSKMLDGVNHA